jgi:hypothetical protein
MPVVIEKSISEWFRSGWATVQQRPFFLFAGVLVLSALSTVGPSDYTTAKPWHVAIGLFFSYLVQPLAHAGYTFFTLKVVREQDAKVSDMLAGFRRFLPLLATYFLYAAIVCIGLLLFVIPGIIWAIKYAFAPLVVLDQSLGPIDALGKSGEITSGYKGKIFGAFLVVYLLVIILSFSTLFVAILSGGHTWIAELLGLILVVPALVFEISVYAAIYHSLTTGIGSSGQISVPDTHPRDEFENKPKPDLGIHES